MKYKYKSSKVKMITKEGYEKMFDSITEAAKYAQVNAWTMSIKMQVFGYFENRDGAKFFRQDEMNTKNNYTTSSPKMKKTYTKKKKPTRGRKVLVDGVLYENCAKASEAIGANSTSVSNALNQNRNTVYGHKIEEYKEENKKEKVVKEQKQAQKQILIETDDPVIQMINERIVKKLKDAGIYEEIKKLSEAIEKLSK